MKPRNVLLLFGGESSEHDVSISSAKNVYEAIDKTNYNVILVYITRSGGWFLADSIDDTSQNTDTQVSINFSNGLIASSNGVEFRPDVMLPILHGKNGEDGALQGLAQLLHIPIVGCDMTGSVLAMDKVASKALFKEVGLTVAPYLVHHTHEDVPSFSDVTRELGEVLFVKPSRAGSSVGVSKVTNEAEFKVAIEIALQHDSLVLIEQAVQSPRELEVAILGNPSSLMASKVGEIEPDREFYSYESKYDSNSQSGIIIPAHLDQSQVEHIRSQAFIAFNSLHCEGMARVDFLLSGDGLLYINEINTIPGFTNSSMYPKLWQHSDISYTQLIDRLIIAASE